MIGFDNIIRYRSTLMGISILFIMLRHCYVFFYGLIGVEFFLLLSAVGLCYSDRNNHLNYGRFFARRMKRVMPAYLVVSIPYFIVTGGDVASNVLFLNLFKNGSFKNWFILMIVIFYLIFPALVKLFNFSRQLYLAVLLSVVPLCFYAGSCHPNIELIIDRIPICMAGIVLGMAASDGKYIDKRRLVIVSTVFLVIYLVSFLAFQGGIHPFDQLWVLYFVLSFCSIPILLMLSVISLPDCVKKILDFFGTITLELYLTHECIALPLSKNLLGAMFQNAMLVKALAVPISIAVAVAMSWILHEILKRIIK